MKIKWPKSNTYLLFFLSLFLKVFIATNQNQPLGCGIGFKVDFGVKVYWTMPSCDFFLDGQKKRNRVKIELRDECSSS
jgi:hypothetical protein